MNLHKLIEGSIRAMLAGSNNKLQQQTEQNKMPTLASMSSAKYSLIMLMALLTQKATLPHRIISLLLFM